MCNKFSGTSSRRNPCLWADVAGAAAGWTFFSSAPARPLGKCSSHIQDIERYQIPFGKCFSKLIGSLSRSRKFANFGVFRLAFGRAMASRHLPQTCDIEPQSSVFQRGTINVRYNGSAFSHVFPMFFPCFSQVFPMFSHVFPCFPRFFPGFPRFFPCFPRFFPCLPHLFPCLPHLFPCFSQVFPGFSHVFPGFPRFFPGFPRFSPVFPRFFPFNLRDAMLGDAESLAGPILAASSGQHRGRVSGRSLGGAQDVQKSHWIFQGFSRGYPHRWMVFREIPNLIAG